MGNLNGEYPCQSTHSLMSDYDALPPDVRAIVRNAPFEIAAESVARAIKLGYTNAMILDEIRRISEAATVMTYGKDHPQAK